MGEILSKKIFYDNLEDYTAQCLTDTIFRDIDYRAANKSPSFFRADFSRSHFTSCTFWHNQFGRADLIDMYITNTEFCEVDFGSCMIKNTTLEKSMFQENNYHGVAIQYCFFRNCTFRDEEFITNMFHCTFVQCTFINCKFQKSSLEQNAFIKCEFIKVDISECVAENLSFSYCSLRDVFLNASMWASYLYKGTDINLFAFKYHGEIVDVLHNESNRYIKQFLINGQLSEFYNARIIAHKSMPDIDLIDDLSVVLDQAKKQPKLQRQKNLSRILDMMQFYCGSDEIEFKKYFQLLALLRQYDWEQFPFEETLEYESRLFQIRKLCQEFDVDQAWLYTVSPSEPCIAIFRLKFDDSVQAMEYLDNVYTQANYLLCGNAYEPPFFNVLSVEQGSIILTVSSIALLTVLISYAAKTVFHNLLSIKVETAISTQIVQRLNKAGTGVATLSKICNIAKESGLLEQPKENCNAIGKLSTELSKGEIQDIMINFLEP